MLELLSQHVASVYPRIDANLILAIKNTHLAEVKRLIKKGILLNAENGRNADGHNTPLILAIKTHDLKLVALLIQHGAQVNPSIRFYSPLMWAIALNNLEMVKLLVQHGAQVNPEYRTETDGSTPLLLALTENKTAIARVLVQHGADVSATRKGFQNPLDLALGTQDLNLIILIIHHANAKISNDIAKRFVTGRIGGLLLDSCSHHRG